MQRLRRFRMPTKQVVTLVAVAVLATLWDYPALSTFDVSAHVHKTDWKLWLTEDGEWNGPPLSDIGAQMGRKKWDNGPMGKLPKKVQSAAATAIINLKADPTKKRDYRNENMLGQTSSRDRDQYKSDWNNAVSMNFILALSPHASKGHTFCIKDWYGKNMTVHYGPQYEVFLREGCHPASVSGRLRRRLRATQPRLEPPDPTEPLLLTGYVGAYGPVPR